MAALTLSTRITLVRVVLSPVLVGLIVSIGTLPAATALAVTCFLVASLTDFVDGYLARRWRQVTTLGNFLDTTADKLLVVAALVGLLAIGRVDVWVAFVIIGREIAVLGLRASAAAASVVVSASIWGKLKFTVQVVGISLAILHLPVRIGPLWLDQWAMIVVAVVSVASAVEYFVRFGDLVRSA